MFEEIKQIVICNLLFAYPYNDKEFEIHTNASEFQLGAVISQ